MANSLPTSESRLAKPNSAYGGTNARSALTPQMAAYMEKFADSGDIRWMPYLMYFHPARHASAVVNTDAVGFRYSEANKNASIVWSPETLEPYLADPKKVIPGTIMAFAGLKKAEDRANVIAYLVSLR